MGGGPTEYLDRAFEVLQGNWKEGSNRDKTYGFACPSRHEYKHQWFWDSCFHAVILASIEPDKAESELRSLISTQKKDGMIPHISLWEHQGIKTFFFDPIATRMGLWTNSKGPTTTAMIQPPVLAVALEELYLNTGKKDLLEDLLPEVEDHYRYLRDRRDPDHDFLISIIHPFESGTDQSPAMRVPFGKKVKPSSGISRLWGNQLKLLRKHQKSGWKIEASLEHYDLETVLMNSMYAWNLRSLSSMNDALGRTKESENWNDLADKVEGAILEKMWDDERKIFVDEYGDKTSDVIYIGSLLPLLLETIPQDKVDHLVDWLTDEDHFWTRYPIPVVPKSSEYYNPGRAAGDLAIWGRGNTWINTNWMVWLGLHKQAIRFDEPRYKEIADDLRERTLKLVSLDGYELHEYYNGEIGEAYGPKDFGWSGLFAVDPKIRDR